MDRQADAYSTKNVNRIRFERWVIEINVPAIGTGQDPKSSIVAFFLDSGLGNCSMRCFTSRVHEVVRRNDG